MSTEDFEMNYEAIISRVRSGMTRDIDGTWLEWYHEKLLSEIELYKLELEYAVMALEVYAEMKG